jgi:hypothetical protein
MMRPNNRYGKYSAAVTYARLKAEPVSLKTSNGRANTVKELPRLETVCPTRNFQKSGASLPARRVSPGSGAVDSRLADL